MVHVFLSLRKSSLFRLGIIFIIQVRIISSKYTMYVALDILDEKFRLYSDLTHESLFPKPILGNFKGLIFARNEISQKNYWSKNFISK